MYRFILVCLIIFTTKMHLFAQSNTQEELWWKKNNLRVIQMNLPDYEAATMNPDSVVNNLINHSANTLIINAGGIMAFYPTKLDFHYTNPYIKNNTLGDIIKKCHENGIKVMVRVDFSRIHESIFKKHPDWCYLSPKGERMINTDMYVVSINAPYVQEKAFRIIEEIMDFYPIDGIFLNMPGYQVRNPYEDKYHGIDQNEFDRKSFEAYSNGLELPLVESSEDPVYQKYLAFKKYSVDQWSERLHRIVKAKNRQIAICTYMDKHVDIIRHESQSNPNVPYWPYTASDNVGNAGNSYPDHIISNASIQQISFQSRYNAVEPGEVRIRLYENIANGSGLDLSMMGDMQGYEDERNFDVFKKVYAHHKKFETYYGNYRSIAKLAVISPGSWVHGEQGQEYRGILLMLKEAHIPFDIIEMSQIVKQAEKLKTYQAIIFPEITNPSSEALDIIKSLALNGSNIIATNRSFSASDHFLSEVFGAKIIQKNNEGAGNYLVPSDKNIFKRFSKQKMLFWKFNLGLYDFTSSDEKLLPILSKGRPGPPEIIGGHDPIGYFGVGIKKHHSGKAVLLPMNIGRLYYMHGYQQHKNIMLDLLDYILPEAAKTIQTNAPEKVEIILNEFAKNTPENRKHRQMEGLMMHLINLTGFSGNTYFDPLDIYQLEFRIKSSFKPSTVRTMTSNDSLKYTWENGYITFKLPQLKEYEAVIISK